MASSQGTRPHPAPIKVIGLGLPRTGTSSLRDALNMLGFGPCYHMSEVIKGRGKDCKFWWQVQQDEDPVQAIDTVLAKYTATIDFPSAMYPEIMYAAFPQAKFILTVRPAEKWYASVKNTVWKYRHIFYRLSFISPTFRKYENWIRQTVFEENGFHRGRFLEDGVEHFEAHNAKMQRMIPKEQLLVLEAGKHGWEPLCDFLGVPVPNVPFPHANETEAFQAKIMKSIASRVWRLCIVGAVVGLGVVGALWWNFLGNRGERLLTR